MLTQREFDVLVAISEQKEIKSQKDIANELNMSVSTFSKYLKLLKENGLVCNRCVTQKGFEALEPFRVKRAIIMAAGFGSRLVPVTLNTPKPLVRVKGTRIIDSIIDAILRVGIEEIYVIRGYLSEQFDQLLYKYPMIKFIENPLYNEANNIMSIACAGGLIKNAYICEGDLLVRNPKIIKKYQYRSNYLAIPMERTDDWCFHTENGVIKKVGIGGINCHQVVGISYWTEYDGARIVGHIKEVLQMPGGKERLWGQIPLVTHASEYIVTIRECKLEDVVEIDTFKELKEIDPVYDV